MRKAAVVRARIEPSLKAGAEAALQHAGVELSDAIRLFLRQVIQHGGLPFPLQSASSAASIVRPSVMESSKRARQRAERARSGGVGRFFIAPKKARAARVKWPDADYDR